VRAGRIFSQGTPALWTGKIGTSKGLFARERENMVGLRHCSVVFLMQYIFREWILICFSIALKRRNAVTFC
jgi:hypothetical protein